MKFSEVFGNAIWIGAPDDVKIPCFRRNFNISSPVKKAEITILGLGTYIFYINGKRGTEDLLLPLFSDFEHRDFPSGEILEHRSYPSTFDITDLINTGENTLGVLLGKGWYNGILYINGDFSEKPYGSYKLCYQLVITYEDGGKQYIVSSTEDRCNHSYIVYSDNSGKEHHDYRYWDDRSFMPNFDDHAWPHAVPAKPMVTDYHFTDCPTDRVIREIIPVEVFRDETGIIYDTGENTVGFPVLRCDHTTESVCVTFSEELLNGNQLDPKHGHLQNFRAISDGKTRLIQPQAIWFGFRYFKVEGNAIPEKVCIVHSNVATASSFHSSDDTLNWLYNTYRHTQLCNLHYGIPSDCPHIERRGYTGDGQLACRAAMRVLEMKKFYAKWIQDISDCQDRVSGHVQYTAPYTRCGGGPGGWGCAIVTLPYEYYKFYGDDRFARELYPQMLRYFDYLEDHSENNLVTSDREGEWCLGEWCTPGPVALPAPFVNNYFYIKSLERVIELAKLFGHDADIPMLEERLSQRRSATKAAYFNTWDSNFIGNLQGANAFALDMGIGDHRTKEHFIRYYEEKGHYDTGIFGTDIVTRLLFEYGRPDVAVKLMTASEPFGFGKWMKDGATSLWEYWYNSRSHSHPMFGAVASYLFEYVLGIRQESGNWGHKKLRIEPVDVDGLTNATGHITTSFGIIHVSYDKDAAGLMNLNVTLPQGIEADIIASGKIVCNYQA